MMELILATNPIVLAILSFSLATMSVTISRSTLTVVIRDWLDDKIPIAGKLLACPYCVAHWIAIPLCLYFLTPTAGIFLSILMAFTLIGMAALIMGIMMKLFLWQEDEIAHLRDQISNLKAAEKNVQERSESQTS